jgi:hypothetical protein
MTCELARRRLPAYVQDRLSSVEAWALRSHLLECETCHREYEYQERLESPLRELAPLAPPPALSTSIRLQLFSNERLSWWDRWRVRASNLMRPVALPAAGGLLAALTLFVSFVPALAVAPVAALGNDVPTILSTEPRFKTASPFSLSEDLMVEAWIDERGNIASFELLNAPQSKHAAEQTRLHSSNVLLTTLFEPATRFGQPIAGRVVFSMYRINIRP